MEQSPFIRHQIERGCGCLTRLSNANKTKQMLNALKYKRNPISKDEASQSLSREKSTGSPLRVSCVLDLAMQWYEHDIGSQPNLSKKETEPATTVGQLLKIRHNGGPLWRAFRKYLVDSFALAVALPMSFYTQGTLKLIAAIALILSFAILIYHIREIDSIACRQITPAGIPITQHRVAHSVLSFFRHRAIPTSALPVFLDDGRDELHDMEQRKNFRVAVISLAASFLVTIVYEESSLVLGSGFPRIILISISLAMATLLASAFILGKIIKGSKQESASCFPERYQGYTSRKIPETQINPSPCQ